MTFFILKICCIDHITVEDVLRDQLQERLSRQLIVKSHETKC